MPVLITGAEDSLGGVTARRLLAGGGEVRLWLDAEVSGDEAARSWRAAGCKAAIGTNDDEGRLEAALEQVHTVIHLAGGPLDDPDEATDAMATLVSAALGAGCRRFVWVTDLALAVVGDLDVPPPYVTALAERAGLVADLPMDVVVIRTGLRYGPDDRLTRALAVDGVPEGELGRSAVPHAPVWMADVAGAVAAADAQRGDIAEVQVAVDLVGPAMLPLGTVAGALAATVGQRAGGAVPGLSADVRDWLRVPAVGGADALGQSGTAFGEGLRRLADRAGAAAADVAGGAGQDR